MLQYLEHKIHCFKAGGLREYYNEWQALTSDLEILQMILGQPIEFTRTPYQRVVPKEKKILDLDEQYVMCPPVLFTHPCLGVSVHIC